MDADGHWLGEPAAPAKDDEGYAELVAPLAATFGPGTEADLVWWLGATKAAVRAALADVGAVEVALDGGGTGWVLPDDLDDGARRSSRGRRCCRCSTRR